jgi:hypothetical protein
MCTANEIIAASSTASDAGLQLAQHNQLWRPVSPPPELPRVKGISRKISLSFLKTHQQPPKTTLLHAINSKPRPSIQLLGKGVVDPPEVSSGETSGNSGKSSNLPAVPARNNSTNTTSIESKYSSRNSAERRLLIAAETPAEAQLMPIQEMEVITIALPQPRPSKLT